jgi:hypothetical protein
MTNTKPEALRLAVWLETSPYHHDKVTVATELRRLHEVNAELLEALKEIIPKNLNLVNIFLPDKAVIPMDFTMGEFRKIAAVIAKAEVEK